MKKTQKSSTKEKSIRIVKRTTKTKKSQERLSDEIFEKMMSAIRLGMGIAEVCRWSGVPESTFHAYVRRHNLKDEYERSKVVPMLSALQTVMEAIRVGKNVEAAKWLLKVKYPEQFSERLRFDVSIKREVDVILNVIDSVCDDENRRRILTALDTLSAFSGSQTARTNQAGLPLPG